MRMFRPVAHLDQPTHGIHIEANLIGEPGTGNHRIGVGERQPSCVHPQQMLGTVRPGLSDVAVGAGQCHHPIGPGDVQGSVCAVVQHDQDFYLFIVKALVKGRLQQ
ncbi:hypothetical protein D3C84_785880 [compost metagenome]